MKSSRFLFISLAAVLLVAGHCHSFALPTIVIDAGHGGHDRGGVPGQRYSEKVYALDVAQRLNGKLRGAGFRTVMTRSGDYFIGLRQRCAIANGIRGSVFVSVHFNSAPREGANGIETYWHNGRSNSLALAIHREVVRAAGTEDRRVRRRGFYVVRNTRGPAILAELGFLTNGREGGRIASSSAYRDSLADALARGVIAKYK